MKFYKMATVGVIAAMISTSVPVYAEQFSISLNTATVQAANKMTQRGYIGPFVPRAYGHKTAAEVKRVKRQCVR